MIVATFLGLVAPVRAQEEGALLDRFQVLQGIAEQVGNLMVSASRARASADFELAERQYLEAESLMKSLPSTSAERTELDLAPVRTELALTYWLAGDLARSDNYLQGLLAVSKRLDDPEAVDDLPWPIRKRLGSFYYNLAALCRQSRNYDIAENLYKKSIAYKENFSGKEDPSLINSLNGLFILQAERRRWTDAQRTLDRAKSIAAHAGDVEAGVVDNLKLAEAGLRLVSHHPEEATRLLESITGPGADDPFRLKTLGLAYKALHRFPEAETAYVRAFRGLVAQLGDLNPEVAFALNNLSVLQEAKGDLVRALEEKEDVNRRLDAFLDSAMTLPTDLQRR